MLSMFLSGIEDISSAINTRQHDKVKQAVLAFDRASRKTRDRRRNIQWA
jgi:transportin-3